MKFPLNPVVQLSVRFAVAFSFTLYLSIPVLGMMPFDMLFPNENE